MTIEAAIEPLPVDESFAVPATEEQLRRAVKGLTGRGYTTHLVDTSEHARALVRQLLPRDRAVLTANSETLRLSGILADVDESGEFRSMRAELATVDPADIRTQIRMGATPDVVLGSVHAVTEDGVLVAASASGSQLGPYAAGAERVIWVVGAQKVVPDLDTALRRGPQLQPAARARPVASEGLRVIHRQAADPRARVRGGPCDRGADPRGDRLLSKPGGFVLACEWFVNAVEWLGQRLKVGPRVGAAMRGPLALATVAYGVTGWMMLALGLVAFTLKPWLGLLFFAAYAVYFWREIRGGGEHSDGADPVPLLL